MSQALTSLLNILELEKIAEHLYRGNSQDLGLPQVFGGQVIGQALYAAKQTVPEERIAHSFHSYFLRPGDSRKPIIYEVEILRDGNSFSARRVSAIQNDLPIFYMTVSFQTVESGFEHQATMPNVAPPEKLKTENELLSEISHLLPESVKHLFLGEKPIEIRPLKFHNPLQGKADDPVHCVWFRANGPMPDDLRVHQYLLGYASDFTFLPTALQPHGVGFLEAGIQIATIDHSMWFHRPFNFEEWLLYAVESPSASGGRGFVKGQFFDRNGTLIASSVQEGVIRRHSI